MIVIKLYLILKFSHVHPYQNFKKSLYLQFSNYHFFFSFTVKDSNFCCFSFVVVVVGIFLIIFYDLYQVVCFIQKKCYPYFEKKKKNIKLSHVLSKKTLPGHPFFVFFFSNSKFKNTLSLSHGNIHQ